MKKIQLPLLLLLGVVLLSAFGNRDGFQQTTSGLQYKIYKSGNNNPVIKEGDFVSFDLSYYTDKDSLLQANTDVESLVFLDSTMDKAQMMYALCVMSKGDSAVFRINSDKLFNPNDIRPPFFPQGSYLYYTIKVNGVKTQAEIEKEEKDRKSKMKKDEDKVIAEYATAHNLKLTTTPSGLRYQITEPVKGGLVANTGDTVSVHYTGTLIDGKKFDSSRDRNQPITFQVNKKMVIAGWDEGLLLMKKGEKAVFVIPSALGYGGRDMGVIPSHSILVFDVELVDIKPKK